MTNSKNLTYNYDQNPRQPLQWWFQESHEGLVLFVVFYTLACRYNRCANCSLPSQMSPEHVSYNYIMAQVHHLFDNPEILKRRYEIKKVIISNNGSILDRKTFSITALMYLIAKLNIYFLDMEILSIESRPEFVNPVQLEFVHWALQEGNTSTNLEVAIGFEAFDEDIRNKKFKKGLKLEVFEEFVAKMARHGFAIKCYFMLKPVSGVTDEEAVEDIHKAIDYLDKITKKTGVKMNMHLNPTYVSAGTPLEESFASGEYIPPTLQDTVRAAIHAKGKSITMFIGTFDEDLAVEGGSFRRPGDEQFVEQIEEFNRTQDYSTLERLQENFE